MNCKRQTLYTIIFSSALLAVSAGQAQVGEIPREARVYVENWLFLNCSTPQEQPGDSLKIWGETLVPLLVESYRSGPADSLLEQAGKAAEQRYADRRKMLESGESTGLSEDDLGAARSVSRETYLKRQQQNFINRYKSQALSGLGIVGGESAKKALQEAADDENSPLRDAARDALKKLE